MVITEKSYNSITTIPIESKLFTEGHIFIENEISSETAETVKKQIIYLLGQSSDKPIWLHIDSPGGDITAGLMIYDIIQSFHDRIFCVCTGRACSMAAVILASGARGHRFILPNSETMIHEPLLANGLAGNCSSIEATSKRLIDAKQKLNEILAKHTGRSVEEINEQTSFDNYLSAEETVSLGLADRIISFKEITEGKINE